MLDALRGFGIEARSSRVRCTEQPLLQAASCPPFENREGWGTLFSARLQRDQKFGARVLSFETWETWVETWGQTGRSPISAIPTETGERPVCPPVYKVGIFDTTPTYSGHFPS
jgi:hypothetical protein